MQVVFDKQSTCRREFAVVILAKKSTYILTALDGIDRVNDRTISMLRETLPDTLTSKPNRFRLRLFGAQRSNGLLEFLFWILFVVHLSSPSGECQVILLQVSTRAMQ